MELFEGQHKEKQQPYIVFDHNIHEFWQNRILNRSYMSQFPGAISLTELAETAQNAGYQVMTADVFLANPTPAGVGFCITEIGSIHTDDLLRRGVIPAIYTCGESPIIAFDFYHNLARYVGRYQHAFLFGGASKRLKGTGVHFHPFFWPNASRQVTPGKPWTQKRKITMINSNKRAFQLRIGSLELHHPLYSLRKIFWYFRNLGIRYCDPWMRSDLYLERLRAIEYFSHEPGFDLYGNGWDTPVHGTGQRYQQSIQKAYRGKIPAGVENKGKVLREYKFAICFENTSFPGYITEKLFDCFFAGCIPIYYGAPDIAEHVPANAFIDFRNFQNYEQLEKYILTMSAEDAARYLQAAAEFLASPAFDKFHVSAFTKQIMLAIEDVAKHNA